jgi:hypothetical protein
MESAVHSCGWACDRTLESRPSARNEARAHRQDVVETSPTPAPDCQTTGSRLGTTPGGG